MLLARNYLEPRLAAFVEGQQVEPLLEITTPECWADYVPHGVK